MADIIKIKGGVKWYVKFVQPQQPNARPEMQVISQKGSERALFHFMATGENLKEQMPDKYRWLLY